LVIPSGKHSIEFKFEPKIFNRSYTISLITSWVLIALLLGSVFYFFKKSGKDE